MKVRVLAMQCPGTAESWANFSILRESILVVRKLCGGIQHATTCIKIRLLGFRGRPIGCFTPLPTAKNAGNRRGGGLAGGGFAGIRLLPLGADQSLET